MEPLRLDFEALSRALLRALRGRRSQTAFSHRLGYRTNVAYAWESGRRWPTGGELLRAAGRSRIDVRAALTQFLSGEAEWLARTEPTSREGVALLLETLRSNVPIVDVARRCGRSRFAVARWLAGDAEPRLPDFLRMIEACSLRVLDFVALWTEPAALPPVAHAWARLVAHREAAHEHPWLPAVLRVLELETYRAMPAHRPGWIASRLGMSPEEEKRCLDVLARTGQIRRRGRRWTVEETQTVDTRPDREAERRLKLWSARVGLERLGEGADGLFSFNVFCVSHADLERLRDLHRRHFQAMRAIIAESTPSEEVVVANLQLFPLGERAPRGPGDDGS